MKIWYIIRIHGEICSSYFKSGNEFPKSADFTKTSIFTNRKLVFLNNFFPKKYPWKEQKWKNERAKEFGTRFRFPAICWWRSRIKKFEKIHRLGKRKTISNSYKGISAGDKIFLAKINTSKCMHFWSNKNGSIIRSILSAKKKFYRIFVQFLIENHRLKSKNNTKSLKRPEIYINDLVNGWTST